MGEDIWYMHGLRWEDPSRVRTPDQLIERIDQIGFLPLFRNSVPGFSVEEMTFGPDWWTGNEMIDPWEWRRLLADGGRVAYGKFFDKKAGFISLKWMPDFANWRRDGYDFDSLWEDELASFRQKKIMDRFGEKDEWFSFDLKRKAGFGPGGEKNFEGVLTDLMMRTYVTVRDFRCRLNKEGKPYGWHVAVYTTPEAIWGYDAVTAAYREKPETSREKVYARVRALYPLATEGQIRAILKG
ncbi:MAG: hypothetical protein IJ662_07795 [Clostridia bacterium]|nr:hypothetical protein [Clostridia bacterium]